MGDRDEVGFGEQVVTVVSKRLSFVMVGALNKYKPIHVQAVASGMFEAARRGGIGTNIYLSNEIADLAQKRITG